MALKEYQLLYLDNDIPINRSFYCNNGDIKSRGLEVHVLDNSQAKDCTGLSLRMIIKVPSGDIFEATVANGLVTVLNAASGIYQVLFPDNMGKGRLIAEIQLSNTVPEVIVSRKFSLVSDGSLTSDGVISELPKAGILWDVIKNEAQRQADFEEVLNNADVAVAEKFANLETEYATDLTGVKSQLAENASELDNVPKWFAQGTKKIAFIGDSITAGSETVFRSYPQWFDLITNHGHTVLNKGIYGHTTIDIVNRFDADIIDNAPDYVVINGGKNDISAGWDINITKSNIASMVQLAILAGIVPIISTIIPYGNRLDGSMFFSEQNKTDTLLINDWIRQHAKMRNIYLFDFYADYVNTETGWAIDEYLDVDNLHPNRLGMEILAKRVQKHFSTFEPPASAGTNLLTNADFMLVTNNLANDWDFVGGKTAGITITPSYFKNKYGGRTLKVVFDSSDTNTQYGYIERPLTGWAIGDELNVEIDLMLEDYHTDKSDLSDSFSVRLRELSTGQILNVAWFMDYKWDGMYHFKGNFTVPVGASTIIFQMGFMYAEGTFYVSRPSISKSI